MPVILVTQKAEAVESKVPNHPPPDVCTVGFLVFNSSSSFSVCLIIQNMSPALCVTGDRNHFPENQNVGAILSSFLWSQKGKTEIWTVCSDHTKVCQLGGKVDLHERQQLSFPNSVRLFSVFPSVPGFY